MMSAKAPQRQHDDHFLKYLESKTLLSVQECLDAYAVNAKEGGDTDIAKVVFIDASWWHKGGMNGRQM